MEKAHRHTQDTRQRASASEKGCTISHPEFLRAAGNEDIHHEAIVEHDGAKKLSAEIAASSPADDYFEAKVSVLSEMIKHHVKEEEQPGGMFARARKSEMDLRELGARLAVRKKELMNSSGSRSGSGLRRLVVRENRL